MKKLLLIVALSGLMVSLFAVTTLGGPTLYIETAANGEWEYEDSKHGNDSTNDLSMTNFGMDFVTNRFVYGFELILGTEDKGLINLVAGSKQYRNADFTSLNGSFGYRVVNNDNFHFDLKGKLDMKVYDDDIDTTYSATLIGVDLGFILTENLYLQGSAYFSIAGSAVSDDIYYGGYYYKGLDEDASCSLLKVKFTYFFTNSMGVSLGYRYYSYTIDAGNEPQTTDSALTAGLTFKF